jgi:hypothetical protein
VLFVRDLGGRRRVLARNVKSNYGLGLAAGRIVYADGGFHARLNGVRPDGSGRVVLSRWLVAPLAARGRLVAWIEQHGRRQKVVVRDLRTGRVLLTATPPRCEHGHCYQLEQVTLADRGVVFTRDTSDPDRSWIVRIRFSNHVHKRLLVRHDPQPNLVPSSAGAVYFVVGRGWYRWDFGGRPHRTGFRVHPPAPVLGFERGRWLLATRRGCDYGVVMVDASGRRSVVASPRQLERLVRGKAERCVLLQASTWLGTQPLTAWAVIPKESSEEHEDKGLFGVAFAGPRR